MGRRRIWRGILFFVLAGCVEPFHLSIPVTSINVLVIDGFMNASDSTMEVILSRAVSVASSDSAFAEKGAQVSIEADDGSHVALSEGVQGVYTGKAMSSSAHKYRLNITTQDQRKYSSDFIDILETPPIDSVYWIPQPDGVALFVDSHDPNNATHYYRWTFDETWKYRVPFLIYKEAINGQLFDFDPFTSKTICYITGPSSTAILIYSSAALRQDAVSKFQVNFLPMGIKKLSQQYSINVHQRAITANLYNYWQQIQTRSQNGGSLFDVLPTQTFSNVHSDTDPEETVLGYFSGSTVTDKRLFIDTLELPQYLRHYPANYNCPYDSILLKDFGDLRDTTWFFTSYGVPHPIGYVTTDKHCMDCTLSGGTITPPKFWKK
ncbi:MAG TPA: DUF4249 domain-containing protein [Cyclobacteriaceae bacterium]|nr:DUF4249 domain-containing protein [Cyclobacteriaceae bacterium]